MHFLWFLNTEMVVATLPLSGIAQNWGPLCQKQVSQILSKMKYWCLVIWAYDILCLTKAGIWKAFTYLVIAFWIKGISEIGVGFGARSRYLMCNTFPFEARLRYHPLAPNDLFFMEVTETFPGTWFKARSRLQHLKCYKQYSKVLKPSLIFNYHLLMHYLLEKYIARAIWPMAVIINLSNFKVDLLKTV